MKIKTITIHGDLHGKGRPRFDPRSGRAYTPDDTRRYENEIQAAWMLAKGEKMEGPIEIDIFAYQKLPKRATKADREAAEKNILRPLRTPDVDNIAKVVMDALNGYAYDDDAQVVRLFVSKRYTPESESRLMITVMEEQANAKE